MPSGNESHRNASPASQALGCVDRFQHRRMCLSPLPFALPVVTLWFSPGLPEGARAFSRDADAVPVATSAHCCPCVRVLLSSTMEMVFAVCVLLLSFSEHLSIFTEIFLRSHQSQGTRSFKSNHSRFHELLLKCAHHPSGETRHDWSRHRTFPGFLLANTVTCLISPGQMTDNSCSGGSVR